MPKNRQMQNIIGTEHITDSSEAAIAAQAGSGNVVDDTTPQLGGNLDVNGNAVVSTANGNIELNPNGTGKVVFKGNATKGAGQFVLNCEQNTHGIVVKGPPHSAGASYTLTLPDTDGAANEVLKTDGSGNLDWVAQSSGGSPGGSDTQIHYNNGGSFGGISSFTYDDTTDSEKFVISASSDQELVRITQTGTGKAFVVEDNTNPDNNRFEVNHLGQTAVQGSAGTNSAALYVGGTISAGSRVRAADGSITNPGYGFNSDTNTGLHRPANDTLAFITGGSERLRVGSSGEIGIGGANYGTAGQVLTSNGASSAPTWQAGGGGSTQLGHTPQLAIDFYANTGGVTVYPLLASGQSANDTTNINWLHTVSTTKLLLWPCIAAKTGTINGLQLRTGPSAGDDLHIALYKSDANGLPNGSPAFSTTITPSANTSYTPSISVSGVTKGDILYFASFGQSNRTNLRVIDVSDGGTFVVPRTVGSVNYSAGGDQQVIELSGQTNGVFPTLSSTTAYDGTGEPDYVPRIGITYS